MIDSVIMLAKEYREMVNFVSGVGAVVWKSFRY